MNNFKTSVSRPRIFLRNAFTSSAMVLLLGLMTGCGLQFVEFAKSTDATNKDVADVSQIGDGGDVVAVNDVKDASDASNVGDVEAHPVPTVTFVSPTNSSVGAAINAKITATFTEAMDAGTLLAAGSIQVNGPLLVAIAGTVTYDAASHTVTFAPSDNLANNTTYVVRIGTAATSQLGVALVDPFVWTFETTQTPDTTAPKVAFTAPAQDDAGVAINRKIVATFDEAMAPATVLAAHMTVAGPNGDIGGTVTYAAGSFAATFTPNDALKAGATYTVTVKGVAGVEDLAGNAMAANYVWSFTTAAAADTLAPRVSSTHPMNLAVDVPLDVSITATFNEPMDPQTVIASHFTVMNDGTPVLGTVAYDVANNIVTFMPLAPLEFATTYTSLISTGAKDLAGNALGAGIIANPWTFTTVEAPVAAPTVTAVTPANTSTGVAINTKVTATFSVPMDGVSILAIGTVTLAGPLGSNVPATVSYDGPSKTVVLAPTLSLLNNTTYTATITMGAKDLSGAALAQPFVWSFTTALTPDTTAPFVSFTDPSAGEKMVAINRKIVATFNEAMNPATIIAAHMKVTGPTGPIDGVVTYAAGNFAMTFAPAVNLANSATYTVSVQGVDGVEDLAGNPMKVDHTWQFSTATLPDIVAPQISVANPIHLAQNVPVSKAIQASFTKPMDAGTVTTLTFTLTDGVKPLAGTVKYDVQSNIATFTPLKPLALGTTYTALVTNKAKDLSGNPLKKGVVPNPWTFTTGVAQNPPVVIDLGVAAPFAIAATAGVTNTGTGPTTHINGDIVLSPNQTCNAVNVGSAGTFGLCGGKAPTINGKVITNTSPDTTTATAVKVALNAAFLSISPPAGPPAVGTMGGGQPIAGPTTLGGLQGGVLVHGDNWFTPGVYKSTTSILITGDVTLDGQGDTNAIFIFQSSSSLTTADGAPGPQVHTRILLTNGAKASNVWWQVGSSATLGLYSEFQGNILAAFDITMKTGAVACGRSMAGAWVGGQGAFVFDANVVSVPGNGCPL